MVGIDEGDFMRALIIGGAGLLGTALIPKFEALGHDVVICDNFTGSIRYRVPENIQVFSANATEINMLRHVFKVFRPEIVVVSLAYVSSGGVLYDFFSDVRTVIDSANVISALLTPQVKHVYFCSSGEVYGFPRSKKPLKETRKITQSASHHGTAKFIAERLLSFRCNELGISLTVLRVFDLFGPRSIFSARTGVVNFLISGFMRQEMLGLAGARVARDFIHVEDASTAFVGVVDSGFVGTVNIGTGKGTTLEQVSKELLSFFPGVLSPELVRDVQKHFPAVADITLLDSILPGGWNPKYNVLESLSALVDFRQEEQEFKADYKAVTRAMRGK